MASINKALIMGRLGQDPELRYTQAQLPVTTLNVATSEFKTSKDGQRQEMTEWHRVVVWGKQAENCNKYLKKGRAVFIEGRIQTRAWDDKNGQKRYSTDIVALNVQFMPSAAPGGYQSQGQGQGHEEPMNSDPFATAPSSFSKPSSDAFASTKFPRAERSEGGSSYSDQSSPSLDDIPF